MPSLNPKILQMAQMDQETANTVNACLVSSQVHEMDIIRRKLYDLEQAQIAIKAK
jgi:hypothetical protein